jgi:hypothetical protein
VQPLLATGLFVSFSSPVRSSAPPPRREVTILIWKPDLDFVNLPLSRCQSRWQSRIRAAAMKRVW